MKKRIYVVQTPSDTHLVRAVSKSGALAHIARSTMEVALASQDHLVEFVTLGVPVQEAQPDQEGEVEPVSDKPEAA